MKFKLIFIIKICMNVIKSLNKLWLRMKINLTSMINESINDNQVKTKKSNFDIKINTIFTWTIAM